MRSFRNNGLKYGTYPDHLSWRRLAFHLIRDFFGSRVTEMIFLIYVFTQQVFIYRSRMGHCFRHVGYISEYHPRPIRKKLPYCSLWGGKRQAMNTLIINM